MNDDGKIDYSRYSYRELLQGLDTIDRNEYPRNYENLIAALENVGPAERALEDRHRESVSVFDDSVHDETVQGDPETARYSHFFTALFILGCGSYLICVGDFAIPGNSQYLIHLDGLPKVAMLVSMAFALAILLSFVADFFDTRENRNDYLVFSGALDLAASGIFLLSIFVSWTPIQ